MRLKLKDKKISIILIIVVIIFIISFIILNHFISFNDIFNTVRNKFKLGEEEIKYISYKITEIKGNNAYVVFIFDSEDGINKVKYQDESGNVIECNGKKKVALDYYVEDRKTYNFIAEYSDSTEKELSVTFEIPRIKGNYILKNGIYLNEPDVSIGLDKNFTRYMYLNSSGNLVPGNWIKDEQPADWYDYKNNKWANIYVENEGRDSYYVWIPRYCYKIDSNNQTPGNERMDVKFINVYNEYIDGITGELTTWEELENQGYKIPEAFEFGVQFMENTYEDMANVPIPGYWISKYQLGDVSSYIVDYEAVTNKTSIEIYGVTLNTTETVTKYIYALNGVIYSTENASTINYTFNNVAEGEKYVNVTALNANGEIVGSLTKKVEITEPNKPDLTGFDSDTTFYVYWDENQNEHNEIPISQAPPAEWYNYASKEWANIVTRNDGLETYFVWIPRYQYKLNSLNQRSYIKFIKENSTEVDEGFKIPEAFTFDGRELPGYWITKYQLAQEENVRLIDAEMSSGSNLIRVRDITGSLITDATNNGVKLKYEYYLNGEFKHNGTSNTEHYVFEGLDSHTTYTINIIARRKDTDAYVGAITKKIVTNGANDPDLTGFNPDTTFYVYWDGDEEKRVSIKENPPAGWYDYDKQNWANIVTTANNTESYFTWIPRYEYNTLGTQTNLSTGNRRINVTFIGTNITNSNCTAGYKVPEAFTFNGKELSGYWISKYQLNQN